MRFVQLHAINTLYVRRSDSDDIPHDVRERYEVISPKTIEALIKENKDGWSFSFCGFSKFVRNEVATDGKLGFYVITEDTGMFDSFDIDSEWLNNYGDKHFLITCPITEQNGVRYCQSIMPMCDFLVPLAKLNTCITHGAFCIGTGITIAIALFRLGAIAEHDIVSMIEKYYASHPKFAPVNGMFNKFYMAYGIPHIADYPYLYAPVGELQTTLMRIFNQKWNSMIPQYTYSSYRIYTNVITAHAPHIKREDLRHLDMRCFWNVPDCEHDIGGFLSLVLTQDYMMQKKWKYVATFEDVIKRLFFFHSTNRFCKQNIRRLWRQYISFQKDEVIEWFIRYLKDKHNNTYDDEWLPEPPAEFIDDLLNACVTNERMREITCVMALFKPDTRVGMYKRDMDRKISERLCILRNALPTPDCWDALQAFLRNHQEFLILN